MRDDIDDDFEEDEDWYDDGSEVGDGDESTLCPECGAEVPGVNDKCPACGYWLTDADRLARSPEKPLWLRVTAVVVLVTFLLSLLGFAAAIF